MLGAEFLILSACLFAAPVMTAAQDERVVVLGAIGTNLNGGGHAAAVSGGSGGVRARIAGPLSAFAESRVVLQGDGIYGFVPLRGGLALRF